jgi:hypothetical protein
MKNGEILYNIDSLKVGQKIDFYTESKDIFGNDKVDKYSIIKEKDGVYIEYKNSTGFDNEDKIEFREKVLTIGAKSKDSQKYRNMNLTKSEMKFLSTDSIEKGLIKKGYNLVGSYENGLEFDFENIIMVNR